MTTKKINCSLSEVKNTNELTLTLRLTPEEMEEFSLCEGETDGNIFKRIVFKQIRGDSE